MTEIGPTGFDSVPGITADNGNDLYGVSRDEDVLLSIDTSTGVGNSIGDFGVDFDYTGATWSDVLGGVYSINAADNALYTIDVNTGTATFVVTITGVDFDLVGMELNPYDGVIYACTNDSILYSIA